MAGCRSTAAGSSGARPADGPAPADDLVSTRPVAILLDGSAVLAAADRADLNHDAAVAWFARADEPLLLGALTLGELDVLLQRELGPAATLAVLQTIADGAVRVVAPDRCRPGPGGRAPRRGG